MRSLLPICLVDDVIKLTLSQRSGLSTRFTVIEGLHSGGLQKNRVEGLLLHSKVDQDFLSQFHNLKWIGIRAHNTSYVSEMIKAKYSVFGIPSLAETAVSEHTFALILGLTKQILPSYKNTVSGLWQSGLSMNTEIKGKKLGIIGYGQIGKQVAQLANAFQMELLIAASPRNQHIATHSIEDTLRESDIITLHLSSKPENIHFMNQDRFSLMKKGSIFINTSRGNMVDESALLVALKSGHLRGAGLDVFENEPLLNSELLQLTNVILTPHVGYITKETTERMTDALIDITMKKTNKNNVEEK